MLYTMAKRMNQVDRQRLSKKGKIFVDDVLKNIDLKKYGSFIDINEIYEDYDYYEDLFEDNLWEKYN